MNKKHQEEFEDAKQEEDYVIDAAGISVDMKNAMQDVNGKISLYESSNDDNSSGSGNHSQS